MARKRRQYLQDPNREYYHLISRTVRQEPYLQHQEKVEFMRLLFKFSRIYYIKIITFTVMDNHFHILVRMQEVKKVKLRDLKRRFHILHNEGKPRKEWKKFDPTKAEAYLERFTNVSWFMKDVKERFSKWYNARNGLGGSFWAERFKNPIIERGMGLVRCALYIELNSVRKGKCEKPEEYAYSGIYHLLRGTKYGKLLDRKLLRWLVRYYWGLRYSGMDTDMIHRYLDALASEQREGGVEPGIENEGEESGGEWVEYSSLLITNRFYSLSAYIGSKEYCLRKRGKWRWRDGRKRGQPSSSADMQSVGASTNGSPHAEDEWVIYFA